MKLSFKLSDCLEWEPADQDTLNYTAGRKEGDVLSFEVTNKSAPINKADAFMIIWVILPMRLIMAELMW